MQLSVIKKDHSDLCEKNTNKGSNYSGALVLQMVTFVYYMLYDTFCYSIWKRLQKNYSTNILAI